jgi:hypothetical protein
MSLCNAELGTMHDSARRVSVLSESMFKQREFVTSLQTYFLRVLKHAHHCHTSAFYRQRGPRILMAELNKENINTKQHNCYQNILFLHPEFFFLFQTQHA